MTGSVGSRYPVEGGVADSPSDGGRRPARNVPDVLLAKVQEDVQGCWRWLGYKTPKGYGRVWWEGRRWRVHRLFYELEHGPIPDDLVTDHLCRVRDCANPAHIEIVTPAENNRRGFSPTAINGRKTECDHGHPFSGSNLGVCKGERYCKACHREAKLRFEKSRGA